MNDNIESSPEELVSVLEPSLQTSAGTILRRARQAEGLHIDALAVSLKVPVRKLEALESDQFDLLPDTVFTRALAASVCRALKIDPVSVLALLPHTKAPSLKTDESGINTPFRTSGGGAGVLVWTQLTKPFVLAISILLVGVLVMVFLPLPQRAGVADALKSDMASGISSGSMSPPVPLTTENLQAADAVTSTPAQNLTPSRPDSVLPTNPSSAPGTELSALPAIVPGAGTTTGLIVFTARGSSWIEVVDSKGVVQVRKTIANGEVVGASGVMPLTVVVGRADTTDVQVHGKPFDLLRIAKDNVARFEVK